jgi:hypothetical protein
MNPFDPAIEKAVALLTGTIQASASQCQIVPAVGQAVAHVGFSVHNFYRDLRDDKLRKVLDGQGSYARVLKMLRPHHGDEYVWNLVKMTERKPMRYHPTWAYQAAFCEYVAWTERRIKGIPEVGPVNTPFTIRRLKLQTGVLAFPERCVTYPQGGGLGSVDFTYSVPDLDFKDISIQSELEEIPCQKQLNHPRPDLTQDFDLDYDVFFRDYYCKSFQDRNKSLPELGFPTVVVPDTVEPMYGTTIVIKLRNFVVMIDEAEQEVFVDGTITLHPVQYEACGYTVEVCNLIATLFRGIRSGDRMSWNKLPRPLQLVIRRVDLVAGREYTLSLTTPTPHGVAVTVISRTALPIDTNICS